MRFAAKQSAHLSSGALEWQLAKYRGAECSEFFGTSPIVVGQNAVQRVLPLDLRCLGCVGVVPMVSFG